MQIHTKKKSVWGSDLNQFNDENANSKYSRWCYAWSGQRDDVGGSNDFNSDPDDGIEVSGKNAVAKKPPAARIKRKASHGGDSTAAVSPEGASGSRTKRRSSLRIASPSGGGINTASNY